MNSEASEGITEITVSGFKSIVTKQSIEVRPLTILAGANSSGKSSFVQPLLLLKQTLDATYDPGPLLLDGPNVKFTSGEQFISRSGRNHDIDTFGLDVRIGLDARVATSFQWRPEKGIEILEVEWVDRGSKAPGKLKLRPGMTHAEIASVLPMHFLGRFHDWEEGGLQWMVARERCFLKLEARLEGEFPVMSISAAGLLEGQIRRLIHVPGLRGNPYRTYGVTAVGSTFPGTFENYVASLIAQWQADSNRDKLRQLNRELERLGLTWKVVADPITHTQVELRVGRLTHSRRGGAYDLVSVADVGFGVSQTLPVVVALLVAEAGQVVYVEQPEIHLHPNAQRRMAGVLAEAARRGVIVIAETHSSLLLQAVQTLVAKGELASDLVKLHWFVRNEADGSTEVRSANLDEEGAYGDWPTDFDDVELNSAKEYLDAAEARSRA